LFEYIAVAEQVQYRQMLKGRAMSNDELSHEVIVNAARESAFEAFVSYLGSWWPLAYTFSGSHFEDARIEPRIGGSWYERNDAGETLSWGEVRAYARSERLVLSPSARIASRRRATPRAKSKFGSRTLVLNGLAST
jgi:hypothetical protein